MVKINRIVTTAQAGAKATVSIHGAEDSAGLAPATGCNSVAEAWLREVHRRKAKTTEHVG